MFMDKYRDFKPDAFCREIIDDQIRMIDPEFLSEEEITKSDLIELEDKK